LGCYHRICGERRKRANKYDEKLAVNASFAEVFKVVKKNKEEKKK
jgi:hypothetical protein